MLSMEYLMEDQKETENEMQVNLKRELKIYQRPNLKSLHNS